MYTNNKYGNICLIEDENIFEDSVTVFKEEKMPGKGSGCTSLSSLTIDDDIPPGVSYNQ